MNFISRISELMNMLYDQNDMSFDYWLSELYDENHKEMWDKWNEFTIEEIEREIKMCEFS